MWLRTVGRSNGTVACAVCSSNGGNSEAANFAPKLRSQYSSRVTYNMKFEAISQLIASGVLAQIGTLAIRAAISTYDQTSSSNT